MTGTDQIEPADPYQKNIERRCLRVGPETSGRIAEFSEHEAD
jgi:hypothetical protein